MSQNNDNKLSAIDVWGKLCRPPQNALKTIKGGRMNGKTDINPQWRYKAVTEVYGDKWTYTIDKLWIEESPETKERMAFALVTVNIDGRMIPGIGGSMAVTKETAGLHASDECYKMAVTDALSVALKMIGVASDIYEGNYDGSKYIDREDSLDEKSKLIAEIESLSKEIEKSGKFIGDDGKKALSSIRQASFEQIVMFKIYLKKILSTKETK